VIDLLTAEMKRMGQEPLPQDELDKRKAALTGGFGREIETTDGIAGYVAGLVMQDVPLDELARYTPSIDAVTAAQILDVSRTLIDPTPASIVAAGDAKQFLPALTAKGIKAEVIPADKLNLDSASLR
jgi:zinc protease